MEIPQTIFAILCYNIFIYFLLWLLNSKSAISIFLNIFYFENKNKIFLKFYYAFLTLNFFISNFSNQANLCRLKRLCILPSKIISTVKRTWFKVAVHTKIRVTIENNLALCLVEPCLETACPWYNFIFLKCSVSQSKHKVVHFGWKNACIPRVRVWNRDSLWRIFSSTAFFHMISASFALHFTCSQVQPCCPSSGPQSESLHGDVSWMDWASTFLVVLIF